MKVYTRKIETTVTYVELDGLVVSYNELKEELLHLHLSDGVIPPAGLTALYEALDRMHVVTKKFGSYYNYYAYYKGVMFTRFVKELEDATNTL